MQVIIAIAVAAALQTPQDPSPQQRPPGRPFFGRVQVDFWGDRAKLARAKETDESRESIWAEPIQGADGRVSVYVPPRAVLQFLEQPTRETAKQYLAWQTERMKKLKAAIELLREMQPQSSTEAPKEAAPPLAPGELLYFKKPGCPWCAKQDRVLAQLATELPRLRIEAVGPDDARWQEYDVTVVPTLVIARPGGKPLIARGFTAAPDLTRALRQEVHDAGK